jgi:uncharacterized membrane protein YsdA (DUF1294 family)/cold shock CspA family protein
MKRQGTVENWNDDKGFGFVTPNDRGPRAFVHIKSFKNRTRRPVNGELIDYQLVKENDNRYKAVNIKFVSKSKQTNNPNNKNTRNKKSTSNGYGFSGFFTVAFCLGLIASIYLEKLPLFIIWLYLGLSLILFIVYAIDKSAAQNDRWRTKENSLHLLALLGGWPGAYFAQKLLRHKSSKKEFKIVFWLSVLINVGALSWLFTKEGAHFLNQVVVPMLNELPL